MGVPISRLLTMGKYIVLSRRFQPGEDPSCKTSPMVHCSFEALCGHVINQIRGTRVRGVDAAWQVADRVSRPRVRGSCERVPVGALQVPGHRHSDQRSL